MNLRAAKDERQTHKTYQMGNYDPGGRYQPGTDPMYICIPVYLELHTSGSYLIFYENSFQADFTFAEEAIEFESAQRLSIVTQSQFLGKIGALPLKL